MKRVWLVALIALAFFIIIYMILWIITLDSFMNKRFANANYCTEDSDCIIESYPGKCGMYINKNKENSLSKWSSFHRKVHFLKPIALVDCMEPAKPVCVSSKCVPKQCEIGEVYKNYFECECPAGTHLNDSPEGFFCRQEMMIFPT